MNNFYTWIRQEATDILNTIDIPKFNEVRDKYIDDMHKNIIKYLDPVIMVRIALMQYKRLGKVASGNILDIGAGAGWFLKVCKHYGHKAIGIDMTDIEGYTALNEFLGIDKRVYEVKPFVKLPDFGMKFNFITLFAVTFADNWKADEWAFFLKDLYDNQLGDGGMIIITLHRNFCKEDVLNEIKKYQCEIRGNLVKIWKI